MRLGYIEYETVNIKTVMGQIISATNFFTLESLPWLKSLFIYISENSLGQYNNYYNNIYRVIVCRQNECYLPN